MIADKHRRYLAEGEWLFREGDQGDTAFVIENGLLEICRENNGERERIAQLGPGEMIGEMSLLMTAGLSLGTMANTIHAYPTQVEVLKRIADQYNKSRLTPLVARVLRTVLSWGS